MKGRYKDHPGIEGASIERRIKAFKSSTLEHITEGKATIPQLNSLIEYYAKNKWFEACLGTMLAIEEYLNNPNRY